MFNMKLDPKTKSKIFIKLYNNVKNTKELKEKLISQEMKCCLIRCCLILDPFQVVVAANKALTAESRTTKSIYTEILFNLSISKNISKSLNTFGIQESDKCFLAIYFKEEDGQQLNSEIEGEEVPICELKYFNDIASIKKYYKINDLEEKMIPLVDSIVSRIATKDFLSH